MTRLEELWQLRETIVHFHRCATSDPSNPVGQQIVHAYQRSIVRLSEELLQAQIAAAQYRP